MLKKSALRRITVTSIALFIFGILSIFPNRISNSFSSNVLVDQKNLAAIYFLDVHRYVSRTQVVMKNQDTLNQAREIIEMLTINGSKSHYIPNGFQAVLPSNTKLQDISIQNGILKLDFNDMFLKIPKEMEEDVVECLIFSLTEIPEVQGILLYVNGNLLTRMPNSNLKISEVLTRDFGINKVYDLTKFKNVTKTTTYYVSKYDDMIYYVPVTEISNDDKEKIEIIIERLKSSPLNQTNLMSFLNANAEILDYEILEQDMKLSFNHYLFDDFENKKILEEVAYSIALSMRDTFHIKEVSFLIDGEKVSQFLE